MRVRAFKNTLNSRLSELGGLNELFDSLNRRFRSTIPLLHVLFMYTVLEKLYTFIKIFQNVQQPETPLIRWKKLIFRRQKLSLVGFKQYPAQVISLKTSLFIRFTRNHQIFMQGSRLNMLAISSPMRSYDEIVCIHVFSMH